MSRVCNLIPRACLIPWIIATVLYLYAVVPASFTASLCLPYCHVTFLGVASTLNDIIYLMLALQASTCAAYFLISWQNKRHLNAFTLTSKSHDLSARFALWANVNATRWMIPVSVFHCVFQALINASAASFREYFKGFSTFYLSYLSILFCALAFEAVSHPLLCIRNNEFFQRLLHSAHPSFIHIPFIKQLFYGSIVLNKVGQNFSINRAQPQNNDPVQETAVVNGFQVNTDSDRGCVPPLPLHTHTKPIAGAKRIVQYQANPEKFADTLNKYWSKAANTRIFLNCGGGIPTRVRWFFVNCNLAYILRSVNLLYKASYHIIVLCLGGVELAYVSYKICICSEFLFIVGFYAGYLGIFFSSLERLYATCNLAAKDKAGWTIGLW
uniref:Gustatory receptor n=1 Tax=Romanomermis culicivorax TaxID=13658 RepID=A0A915KHY9_ROMCU